MHCIVGYKYKNNPDDDAGDKDDALEVVVGWDTIQFHEQSWASQARGKKFQPLVQFSHLPPHPHSPIIKIQIKIRKIQIKIRKIQIKIRKIQIKIRKIQRQRRKIQVQIR